MSPVEGAEDTRGTAASSAATTDVDAVATIMQRGGSALRELMTRTELHLERVTSEAGDPLASHATGTVLAGGKRLRPLLVVLAAEATGGVDGGPNVSESEVSGPGVGEPGVGEPGWASHMTAATERNVSCARPSRSSSCTRRRSCTTT